MCARAAVKRKHAATGEALEMCSQNYNRRCTDKRAPVFLCILLYAAAAIGSVEFYKL